MSTCLHGLDVCIGARTKQTAVIGDSGIIDWNARSAYSSGDRICYWGSWYKATKDISSSLWGNDTPDKSDAWVQMSAAEVARIIGHGGRHGGHHGGGHGWGPYPWGWDYPEVDIDQLILEFDSPVTQVIETAQPVVGHGGGHGGYSREFVNPWSYDAEDNTLDYKFDNAIMPRPLLGAYDIASSQKAMNTLKQVTVNVAQALLKGGQGAINYARTIADQRGLPGGTARDNVYWKLQWHQNTLKPLSATPNAMYGAGDDLKKWVMQAFIEANAVEEGAAYMDQAWDNMWREIGAALAALPKEIAKKVQDAAAPITTAVKWTYWIAIGTAVAVLGIIATGAGYGIKQRLAGR